MRHRAALTYRHIRIKLAATSTANAVVFLAAPQSGWITAQVLTVDGGRMHYIGHG
jgi:NAD(P)-dependent dehydrogenase (short-subunit alcohol dehydrogenase family)